MTTTGTTQLTMTRLIRAPRERVFAAWTTPDLLLKWWGPGPVTCPEAHVDLRPGGEYRIANKQQDGSITWIFGTFAEVSPPEKLIYDWSVSILADMPPTRVVVCFNAHPAGTELVLTHERFPAAEIRDMHAQGWAGCIDRLEALLAGARSVSRKSDNSMI